MLNRAVLKASEAGFLGLFLEESPRLKTLLRQLDVLKTPGTWFRDLTRLLDEQAGTTTPESNSLTREKPTAGAGNATLTEPLSQRELEVLALINDGHANKEIASRMEVAPATVKAHIRNLYGKLGVSRRTEALARARDLGLLSG